MQLEEDIFNIQVLAETKKKLNEIVKQSVQKVKNEFEGNGSFKNNVAAGTLNKFTQRINTFIIHLSTFEVMIKQPNSISQYANSFSYTEQSIAESYYVISRLDFMVGMFGLFEDAIKNMLLPKLLTDSQINSMRKDYAATILENEQINKLVKKNYLTVYKQMQKEIKQIPIDNIIRKLKKVGKISKEQEDFLIGYKNIRNTIHNNGHNQSGKLEINMREELFTIENGKAPDFLSPTRTVRRTEDLIRIFEHMVIQTNRRSIKDNTFHS